MDKNLEVQKNIQKNKLKKALVHLNYSYKKVLNLKPKVEELDEEELEIWESFAARFARVCDMFLARYIRTLVLIEDPGYSGSLRDFLNYAEKINLIDSSKAWLNIRELRNIAAHEYSDRDMSIFFDTLRKACPKVLTIAKILDD